MPAVSDSVPRPATSFREMLRQIWDWWRGKHPSYYERMREARLIEKLAAELEDAERGGTLIMGRGVAAEPVPVESIQHAFAICQDGIIIRRQCHIGALNGEPAVFQGMLRLTYSGKIRRISPSRIAWCLAFGSWPRGEVRFRNGDPTDARPENLEVVRRGQNPAAVGRASLERRRAVDAKLISALANHPTASVAEIGRLAGLGKSGASIRLSRLAGRGLAESPKCCPDRSWALTARGCELVAAALPPLDDLDRTILSMLSRSAMRQLALARRVGVCSLTAKRRLQILIGRGMVEAEPGPVGRDLYAITDRGRQAVGESAPVHWIDSERIKASTARDVVNRKWVDDRTREEKAQDARGLQRGPFSYAMTG